jgi:hypothetical protein
MGLRTETWDCPIGPLEATLRALQTYRGGRGGGTNLSQGRANRWGWLRPRSSPLPSVPVYPHMHFSRSPRSCMHLLLPSGLAYTSLVVVIYIVSSSNSHTRLYLSIWAQEANGSKIIRTSMALNTISLLKTNDVVNMI